MAEVTNSMLDHPCDTYDEKMETIYQTDYIKRGTLIMLLVSKLILFFRAKFNAIQKAYACG